MKNRTYNINKKEILKGGCVFTKPSLNPCYVYFLIRNNKVVYVGQALCVDDRFKNHLKSDKEFDRISYCRVSKHEVNEVEAFYIHKFSPELNRMMPRNDTVNVSERKLLEMIASKLPAAECSLKNGKLKYYSLGQVEHILNMLGGES